MSISNHQGSRQTNKASGGLPATKNDVETFERDGFVRLRQAIERRWVDMLRRGIEKNLLEEPHGPHFRDLAGDGSGFTDMFRWSFIDEYERAAMESGAPAIAGHILRANEIVFLEEQMFHKKPGLSAITPWHHDFPYYPLDGNMCIVWIALTHHDAGDSLQLIRGSHGWGRQFVPRDFRATEDNVPYAAPDMLPKDVEVLEDIDGNRGAYDIVSHEMEPGDCIVFHPLTLHGNRGNASAESVARIALRYGAETLVYAPNKYPWVFTEWPFDSLREGDRVCGPLFPTVWRRG